jgi:magnesium chelatase subunit I
MENLISNAERRTIMTGDTVVLPRICDLPHVLPGLTGKIELVFEGEQEGSVKVSKALVGKAVRETFKKYFPDPLRKRNTRGQESQGGRSAPEDPEYGKIIQWFESGNKIEIADEMPLRAYAQELDKVKGLRELTKRHMQGIEEKSELPSVMEFVLDGLHQNSKIAKDEVDHVTSYKDLVGSIFSGQGRGYEED